MNINCIEINFRSVNYGVRFTIKWRVYCRVGNAADQSGIGKKRCAWCSQVWYCGTQFPVWFFMGGTNLLALEREAT
jgi:hypothetical protein